MHFFYEPDLIPKYPFIRILNVPCFGQSDKDEIYP